MIFSRTDLTIREAAEIVRLTPDSVRAWITGLPEHRRLKAHRIGAHGSWRIRREDLDRFLECDHVGQHEAR